jgi:hypothetical protein
MHCRLPRTALLSCLVMLLAPAVSRAADDAWVAVTRPAMRVDRAAAPVTVDGLLDEAAWQAAPRARNFVEHQPGDQVQPPVATEAMLTYDDQYLYCAFVCYDDPQQVRASFTERDRIWNDDYVILAIDTFADQGWAYEIAANPYGIQGDLLWSSGHGEDMAFDLVFHSSGRITDEGWQVEMAIPWTSLRFPDRPEQEWRVDFWRNHPRAVRGQYSWAKYDRDEPCWPCQWGTISGVEGVRPGSGLDILPAFTASQESRGNGDGLDDGPVKGEPSLGVGYGISPTTKAEVTINPDYSQVESDAAQIDVNSTFALFYPEKRPFFQEGADLWNTWFNVVYTRSINQPLWAGKVTGRPGSSNFAVLAAQDETSPYILPFAEQSALIEGGRSWSGLVRYRRTLGEGTHIGVIATDRRHEGGGSGSAFGADLCLRLSRSWQIEFQAIETHTEEPNDPGMTAGLDSLTFDEGRHTAAFDGEDFWGTAFYTSVERNGRHWSFDVDYWSRSPTFRAENGFEPRNDQRQLGASTAYTFYADGSFLDVVQPQVHTARLWDFTGRIKDEWAVGSLYARFKTAQTAVYLQRMQSNENFRGGQYDGIWDNRFEINIKPADLVDGGFEYGYGHRIARGDETMGRQTNVVWWVNIKPVDRLKFYQSFQRLASDALDDGRSLYDVAVARTRLDLQVTREWSLRLVLQYDDHNRTWDADPLVTWRLNPFSIFYVGSTRRYNEFDGASDPVDGWQLTGRTYFLKVQYLFQS